ncbi:iron chaperone [Lentzea sp. JNUCC 0626]|uniref:iron chaperone n=1 Tax=Lentzea sp. JNUCC 0626 TaxID=3367513 RepID=UPI003748CB40
MADVDDYFASLDASSRDAFARIRALAEEVAPTAEQGTSYGMATLRFKGKPLLAFKAAKNHLAVFPFSPGAIDSVRDRLGGYSLSKGTIRFTAERPLPDDVVRDVVRHRLGEIG